MITLLVSLLIFIAIFAVVWYILSIIPIPPQFLWIVRVVFALIFLTFLIELLTGGWMFPVAHPALR